MLNIITKQVTTKPIFTKEKITIQYVDNEKDSCNLQQEVDKHRKSKLFIFPFVSGTGRLNFFNSFSQSFRSPFIDENQSHPIKREN